MKPSRPAGDVELVAWAAESEEDEAERIAAAIGALRERGFRLRDIAVLYRSVRTSAPPLLEALERRGISFSCGGRTGLFLQPDIALFGELFAWFAGGEWRDARFVEPREADLDRVVAGLAARFGAEPTALREYLEHWRSWQLRGLRPVSLVGDYYRLLAELGVHRIDPDAPGATVRLGVLARFSVVLADFEHVHRRGFTAEAEGHAVFHAGLDRGRPYFLALHAYLLHWARDAYEDFAGDEAPDVDAVDVVTVHQAKGLQWPVVFVPALVKGRFPSGRAGRPQGWLLPDEVFPSEARARYEGGDGEERRLFYVAMTRARDLLLVSRFRRRARTFPASPYLLELARGEPRDMAPGPLPAAPPPQSGLDVRPIEVSFSDLARALSCGQAYRLGNVLGFQSELAAELGYGRAVHHVLRRIAELVLDGGMPHGSERLEVLLGEAFYVPFATAPAHERMRAAAARLVRAFVEQHGEDLRRTWAVERPFSLRFDEGRVGGRADVVLQGDDGRLSIVDYKVSDDPGREDLYRLQLAVYAAAARGEGLDVQAASLHSLGTGFRVAVDVGNAATRQAVEQMRRVLADLRAGVLPARPERERCGGCDFRWVCGHAVCPRD